MTNEILDIAATQSEMQAWRHMFHMNPETAFEEVETADFVSAKLEEFGLEVRRGYGKTGLVGVLKSGDSERAIGMRADLDALNLQELNEFEHRSRNEGKMHACGHDGHMAMLMGAAKHLAENPDFDGTAYFIFQPAEEAGDGGLSMINDGLFTDCPVDAVYGLHNVPGMEVGQFCTNFSTLLASMDLVTITVEGVGGHGAFPSLARNPILPACNIVSTLNEFAGSQFSPTDNMVVSICQIEGGDAVNVIPQTVTLKGTARCLTAEAQNKLEAFLPQIADGVCAAYGVKCDVEYKRLYPLLTNTPDETEKALAAAKRIVGADHVDDEFAPFMASDDFAWLLRDNPGNFIFLGNGVGEKGGCFAHNPNYDFNDDILSYGAAYWVQLVQECLPQNGLAKT